eukprot:2630876-Prymnesium_polylepis.1
MLTITHTLSAAGGAGPWSGPDHQTDDRPHLRRGGLAMTQTRPNTRRLVYMHRDHPRRPSEQRAARRDPEPQKLCTAAATRGPFTRADVI